MTKFDSNRPYEINLVLNKEQYVIHLDPRDKHMISLFLDNITKGKHNLILNHSTIERVK